MSQFQVETTADFMKITCPGQLDAEAAARFAEQSKAWMMNPARHFVLDLAATESISRDFYRAVIQFKTSIRRDQKSVYSLNVHSALLSQISADGVELAFNPIASMAALPAERPAAAGTKGFNVEIINPFLSAALKTLEVQCKTKTRALRPTLKNGPLPDIAIAGVLALSSDDFAGSLVLCFPKAVFLRIYENMFDEKHEEITPEIEDAAGELLNIVYGMAKIELNPRGYNFQKALPTVLTGDRMKIRQSNAKPVVVIPFETECGLFYIEIEFDRNTGGK